MNIYLFPGQREKLLKEGDGAAVIRYACKRFLRGDIEVAQGAKNGEKSQNVLLPFSIRALPSGIAPEQVRDILSEHWANPDRERLQALDRSIDTLDRQIDKMFKAMGVQA